MSIIWVHVSAHIVDLYKLTMERQEQIDDGETRAIRVLVTPHAGFGSHGYRCICSDGYEGELCQIGEKGNSLR